MALKRRLNELKNTNDQGINNQDISILEHDILEIETDWIKNQISEDKNYILLEDERPSRSFLNMFCNEVKSQLTIPNFLTFTDITSIWKQKGEKSNTLDIIDCVLKK